MPQLSLHNLSSFPEYGLVQVGKTLLSALQCRPYVSRLCFLSCCMLKHINLNQSITQCVCLGNQISLLRSRLSLLAAKGCGYLVSLDADGECINEVSHLMDSSIWSRVDTFLEHITDLRGSGKKTRHLLGQSVTWIRIGTSQPSKREATHLHNCTSNWSKRTGEVFRCSIQRLLSLTFQTKHGMFGKSLKSLDTTTAIIVVKSSISQVDCSQCISKTSH
mmetsp:Transcript_24465/g.36870  ORF Transcript_24465/g.36870 Transcript_24465/m.36870 type:complete len:219 (-) Transcript_24465:1873-2529(-)